MTDAATTTTLPPGVETTPYATQLFESICTHHGGRERLTTAQLETVLVITRLHGDARAASDAMTRIRALEAIARAHDLLPSPPEPEPTYLDLSRLSDSEVETLHALVSRATVVGEGPSASDEEQARLHELRSLREEVSAARHLRAQLLEVQGERDKFRSEAARLADELHRLAVAAKGATEPRGAVEVLPPVRPTNHSMGALVPKGSPRRPDGLDESEMPPSCRPPYAPGQGSDLIFASGGVRRDQFSNNGGM
jgi:hypothetical protein